MSDIPRVFMAHSSLDKPVVRRIAYDLRFRGVEVWLDEWEIKVGESLTDKIAEGIEGSGRLAINLTANSVASAWVKRELNAGLIKELESKDVFVLPLLLEKCELPLFLKDKKYANFLASYSQGLQELFDALIPSNASSSMLSNLDELHLHMLPAFGHGELVTDYDLNRVQQAINVLESRMKLKITEFELMRKGQIVAARHINQLMAPIDALRRALGLDEKWDHHPVKPLELYTVDHMNELYGKINEAIRILIRD